MNKITCLFLAALVALVCSCEKPPTQEVTVLLPSVQGGMFILNEGNYGSGNASLGFYDAGEQKTTADVFKAANNRPLGDVLQSMMIYNNNAYLVVNNSGRIEIMDPVTFKSKGVINGFKSPRFMAATPYGKAYVTDLTDPFVSVVDLATNTIARKIPVKAATEEIVHINGELFVANSTGNEVFVIDAGLEAVVDTITLTYGPNSMRVDRNNRLWVLCSGKEGVEPAELYRINPSDRKVEWQSAPMAATGNFGATRLQVNGTRDMLYWLNTAVYRMRISDTIAPSSPYVSSVDNTFYGIGIDPKTDEMYLSDALDYSQRSVIKRYDAAGAFRGFFLGGIITNSFYFHYR